MRPLPPACRGVLAAGAAIALAPALSGCGSDDSSELASLAPADAPVYVEGTIRPEGEQADAIEALTEKIAGFSDPGARIGTELDTAFEAGGTDLSYSEDIEPWLGSKGAFFVSSLKGIASGDDPDTAAIVETSDPDAALEFTDKVAEVSPGEVEETSYEGFDYKLDGGSDVAIGVVEDFLVVGTDAGFKAAVDTSGGDSLADSDEFNNQIAALESEDPLLSAYVDPGAAIEAAIEAEAATEDDVSAARALAGDVLEQPLTLSASATETDVTVDVSAPSSAVGPAGGAELLESLPGDPWFGYAISDAGSKLSEIVTRIEESGESLGEPSLTPGAISSQLEAATGLDLEEDILDVIGDLAFFVSGTSEPEIQAGFDISVTDPNAAGAALERLSEAIEGQGLEIGPAPEGADDGFTAEDTDGSVEVALTGDELKATISGADAAGAPESGTLGDSELYASASDALGDDFEPQTFVGIADFLVVAEQGDDDLATDYDAARPYTEDLAYAILGTRSDDDRTISRLVVGVE